MFLYFFVLFMFAFLCLRLTTVLGREYLSRTVVNDWFVRRKQNLTLSLTNRVSNSADPCGI